MVGHGLTVAGMTLAQFVGRTFRSLVFVAATVATPGLVAPAAASAPAAWAASDREAAAACIGKSELLRAVVRPGRVRFSDTLGVDALLVTGLWRQARLPGRRATMLCLYHRSSRTAEVAEAARWSSR